MITELDKEEAIEQAREVLRERTFAMGLECDALFHYELDEKVYVISNPIMGTERMAMEDGTVELVPRRNLCMEYRDIPPVTTLEHGIFLTTFRLGMRLMPVLAPYLIILIDVSGKDIVVKEALHHEH